MAPLPEVVWCIGFIREQGATRWFGWRRILQNNACFCFVGFSFFRIKPKVIGWEERLQNDLLCVERNVKA